MEVSGQIQPDGKLSAMRIDTATTDDRYRKAVEAVAAHWLFNPLLDAQCSYHPIEGAVTLWFEKVDGKAKVSYSIPPEIKARHEAASMAVVDFGKGDNAVRKLAPTYSHEALRRGIERARFVNFLRIERDGSVSRVAVAPAPHRVYFEASLMFALKYWQFPPQAEASCATVEIEMRIVD